MIKRAWEKFKHRQKLSVAIPISNKAYEELLKFHKPMEDMDLGDAILRIIEENKSLTELCAANHRAYLIVQGIDPDAH